jgi:hypothetical protein
MTVAIETPITSATANGVTTVFPYAFTVLAAADLVVQGVLLGVTTTYVLGTNYTLTGIGTPAGSATFLVAPANGTVITIYRNTGLNRLTDYQDNGDLLADTVNLDFDRLWLALQEIFSGGKGSPTALRVPNGETIPALGNAAARANRIQAYDGSGNPLLIAGVDASSAASLALDLASTSNAAKGAALVGFNLALAYSPNTVGARLRALSVSPMSFGGVGDGVADDTAAIVAALAAGKLLDLSGRSWRWTATINLPAGIAIDARGATLLPATGATPCMKFDTAKDGLTIMGGLWSPTSGTFLLRLEGTTDVPALANQYARQIWLKDMHVTSSALTGAIDMQKAVRQVFMDGCILFTPSGINASGKNVEVMVSNSIIYSATGAAGTYGIKLRSTGGTSFYNEGWNFVNCTIDNFELTFDVADIFVLQVLNSYVSSTAAGYAFQFQAPTTTTHTQEINIGYGCVIGGRVRFVGSGAGRNYNCKIGGAIFNGVTGLAIAIENNAASITVSDCKFKAGGGGTPQGVVGSNNNAQIICSNLEFDSTYLNGVILSGAAGANCVIGPLFGPVTGDIFGLGRQMLLRGNPIYSAALAGAVRSFNPVDLVGNYIVGAAISTQAVGFVKGERGWIVVSLPCSGMNAATQRFDIATPTGMVLPSGTGWAANFIFPSAAGAYLSARIPYYCTGDGTGNISITNAVGNTVTLNNHGYFGIEKDN